MKNKEVSTFTREETAMSYRRVREENIKPEYLRLKQAMIVFNMGPDKIEELARDRLCFSEQRGKSP